MRTVDVVHAYDYNRHFVTLHITVAHRLTRRLCRGVWIAWLRHESLRHRHSRVAHWRITIDLIRGDVHEAFQTVVLPELRC